MKYFEILIHHYAWSKKEFQEFPTSFVSSKTSYLSDSLEYWHLTQEIFRQEILCCLFEVSCLILNRIFLRPSDLALKTCNWKFIQGLRLGGAHSYVALIFSHHKVVWCTVWGDKSNNQMERKISYQQLFSIWSETSVGGIIFTWWRAVFRLTLLLRLVINPNQNL